MVSSDHQEPPVEFGPPPRDALAQQVVQGEVSRRLFGTTPAPTRVGRYQIVRRIGVGGLGAVYEAHDPKLGRRVAVKVLRPDPTRSSMSQQRLLREAHVLARLSHPNIVHVYDAGESAGEVFIAMELVSGPTLREWLGQRKRTWKEIVAVFAQAGRGLAAAHAVGVAHRDFKPDNVLVDADDRPRVLDFGLARPVGASSGPAVGGEQGSSPAGTPGYAAPEQERGDPVDGRADQYSFCVALYEALHGSRPSDPRRSSARVPARIRAIVSRGLNPNRDGRWPDMVAVVDRLQRALRPRVRVASLVVIAAAVVAGGFVAWKQESRCTGATKALAGIWDADTRGSVDDALRSLDSPMSAPTAALATQRLDDYARRWRETYTEACEATTIRGELSPQVMDARMHCLQVRAQSLQAAVTLLSQADVSVLERAVEVVDRLPSTHDCEAVRPLDVATVTDGPALEVVTEAEYDLAEAEVLLSGGRVAEAVEAAQAIIERIDDVANPQLHARAKLALGRAQEQSGDPKLAESTLTEAYFLARGVDDPRLIGDCASELGFVVGVTLTRPDDGLLWLRHAEHEIERGAPPRLRWETIRSRGLILQALGDYEAAERDLRDCVDLSRQQPGEVLETAECLRRLSGLLNFRGKRSDALATAEEARGLLARALGEIHPRVGGAYSAVGIALDDLDRNEEAQRAYARASEILERTLGRDHPRVGFVSLNLGTSLLSVGRHQDALAPLRRAGEIISAAYGPDHILNATVSNGIGTAYRLMDDVEAAEAPLRRALVSWEQQRGADHPQTAAMRLDLAMTLTDLDPPAAVAEATRGRDVMVSTHGLVDKRSAVANAILAAALVADGRPGEAVEELEPALLALVEGRAEPRQIADAQFTLARALHSAGGDPKRIAELTRAAAQTYEGLGVAARRALVRLRKWQRESTG